MLNDSIKQQIKEQAILNKPFESCGLLLSTRKDGYLSIYPCKNIACDKENYFELFHGDYLRASNDIKNKIVGMYHTQCNSGASLYDYVISKGHNIYSIVYSWKTDTFFEINDSVQKYIKYIGKEFNIGITDCFSLVRDFYKNEYNINIFNYLRTDNWFKDNPKIIEESYGKEGFLNIDNKSELKNGDVIGFKSKHFGIYLENDLLLHHKRGRLSNVEPFTKEYKDLISNIYRHKSFLYKM
jgi:proteasome lid subunit RPN8/RPN11